LRKPNRLERASIVGKILFALVLPLAAAIAPEAHARDAADEAPSDASAVEPEAPSTIETIEEALNAGHRRARRSVSAVADRLDRFFVDQRLEDRRNETRLRLGLGVRVDESRGIDPLFRFRLDLSLPRTQRRLALVVASFIDEDAPEDVLTNLEEDRDVAGFLRFFAVDRERLQVSLDTGLRFSPVPDPFTRVRLSREYPWGRTLLRPAQEVFWRLDDGFGERTRIDFDRRLSMNTLARVRTQATYSEVTEGVDLDVAAFLFRQIDVGSGLRFEVGLHTLTDPPRVVEAYRASVLYRRSVYRTWLFVEIEPQLHFRRDDDYRFSPGVILRLETIIGPGVQGDGRTELSPNRSVDTGAFGWQQPRPTPKEGNSE